MMESNCTDCIFYQEIENDTLHFHCKHDNYNFSSTIIYGGKCWSFSPKKLDNNELKEEEE